MSTQTPAKRTIAPALMATAIILTGLIGVAAYSGEGVNLFVRMVETGLAWCF